MPGPDLRDVPVPEVWSLAKFESYVRKHLRDFRRNAYSSQTKGAVSEIDNDACSLRSSAYSSRPKGRPIQILL